MCKKVIIFFFLAFPFVFFACDDGNGTITDEFHPDIDKIDPSTAAVGQDISIIGSYFGELSDNNYVEINGSRVDAIYYKSWSTDIIVLTVPPNTQTGGLRVVVGSKKSGTVLLTIIDEEFIPVIDNLSQGTIQPGNLLNIFGKNFGDSQNDSYVMFGNVKASEYANWTDTKITVKVPMNAKTGDLWVVVGDVESNSKLLVIDEVETLLDIVEIPAGTFIMGKDVDDPWDVAPAHQVTIDFDFYMSTTEITQAQWKKVMAGSNPSKVEYLGDDKPVHQVTWHRAVEFCNRLSDMEGLDNCYTINGNEVSCDFSKNGWRLPTEAEWEYCCRAGTTGDFGGSGNIDEMGWTSNNSDFDIQEVAKKQANAFGLYDMHGNVYEWCWDWYSTNYYSESPSVNPTGSDEEIEKVLRGGSFTNDPVLCNSWVRLSVSPTLYNYNWGFRVVRKK
jgi:formylglycine-generating enzyme